jgi:ATP-dependent RNA helicase RhlE
VRKEDKTRLLNKLLDQYHGPVLVFSRTKFGAKKIARAVGVMHHKAAEIHSNRSLNQRREALDGFKNGKYRVLVATDIAARGIDVTGIEVVVNFDLPENAEDYVHRIGRTGRAGHAGRAISFATPDQRNEVRDIERLMRINLPISKLPELPAELKMSSTPRDEYRQHEQGRSRTPGNGRPSFGGKRPPSGPRSFHRRRY